MTPMAFHRPQTPIKAAFRALGTAKNPVPLLMPSETEASPESSPLSLHLSSPPLARPPKPLLTRGSRRRRKACRTTGHSPIKPSIPTHHPLPFLHLDTHPLQHRQSFRPQRSLLVPSHTSPRGLDQLQIVLLPHLPRQIPSLAYQNIAFHNFVEPQPRKSPSMNVRV